MAKTYPVLPEGPVMCETCAKAGHHIDMQRDDLDESYLDPPRLKGTDLQSYRCPRCESVTVFQVR